MENNNNINNNGSTVRANKHKITHRHKDFFNIHEVDVICTPSEKVLNQSRLDDFILNVENEISDSIKIIKYNLEDQSSSIYLSYENSTITCFCYTNDVYTDRLIAIKYEGTRILKIETAMQEKYFLVGSSDETILSILKCNKAL